MKTKHILAFVGLVLAFYAMLYLGIRAPSEGNTVALPEPDGLTGSLPVKASDAISLLTADSTDLIEWNDRTPAAFRARVVEPDFAQLTEEPILQVGDRIQLPLFEDALIEGLLSDVTVYPNGSVGMTANLDNGFRGFLYLSYSGGELRASVDVLGGNDFYIRYDHTRQRHVAIEVDLASSDYDGECEICLPEPAPADMVADDADPATANPPVMMGDAPADALNVDVMVVYTPAAKAAEGGLNGINNNIALAMQRANTAHDNSDTKITLTLVHSAETSYTESGDPGLDLRKLTYTGGTNSAMDDVQSLRDTYSADFICLFEDEPGTGGIGWLLTSESGRPDLAYCLARVQQSDWTYTVVHEWGHNMGCSHSKTQTSQPWESDDLYSYSAGWQWSDSASSASVGFCSVMTYENFDSSGGYEYDRVPHFSNPDIDYTGNSTNPTGDAADGDNARTMRGLRYVYADYRISTIPVSDFPSSNSFEQAYSPWRYYGSDIDWERDSGGTPSSSTGPSTGYDGDWYVYLEATGEDEGAEAHLSAAFDFSALSAPDISFAYHMYGSSMGTLYLEASTNGGGSWDSLWSMTGDLGNTWFATNINLSAYAGSTNTQLRFRGVTGSGFRSDMALDTIMVQEFSNDSDGDGMPNDWETLYFGGPTNGVAGANPDNDSYTNLQEYIAGLNPNIADGFGPSNLMIGAENEFEWTAASGRIYSVYWTSNLLDGFTLLQSNLTSGAYTDSAHSAESQGFYRLEVELAP
jgi:hypothetical protein